MNALKQKKSNYMPHMENERRRFNKKYDTLKSLNFENMKGYQNI